MRAFVCLLALSLAGCDTIAWGFVNRLPHRVTVIQHFPDHDLRTPLAPGERIDPGFGHNRPFELLDAHGVAFAHYRPSQLRVLDSHAFSYVVIRHGQILVEPKEKALAGLPSSNAQ
ncbi:MAG: hypothetical protein M3Q86_14035 [Verrucomicrobiota bacterium]|nr:hypothetical protein [Verrucomicrobiota bacterium]